MCQYLCYTNLKDAIPTSLAVANATSYCGIASRAVQPWPARRCSTLSDLVFKKSIISDFNKLLTLKATTSNSLFRYHSTLAQHKNKNITSVHILLVCCRRCSWLLVEFQQQNNNVLSIKGHLGMVGSGLLGGW